MKENDVKKEVTDKYSLRGRVYNRLREDILSGVLKENEELPDHILREGTRIYVQGRGIQFIPLLSFLPCI